MIDFEHVSKTYETHNSENLALDDINIHIDEGEFVFILGHSGAGKSTFLKLMQMEERPTEGKVFINGQDLTKIKRRKVPYYRWEGVGLHGEQNIKAGEGPVESLCLCGKDLAGVNVAGRVLTRQGEGIFAHGAPSFRVLLMTV